MTSSAGYFFMLAAAAGLTLALGQRIGRESPSRAAAGAIAGLSMLAAWVWLVRHPAVAVHALPVSVLTHLEGAGAVPFFTLIIGIVWARSQTRAQRRLVGWTLTLALVYFLQGSLWMLQSTPGSAMAQSADDMAVRQSQDYSCVPAACATALNRIGLPTSEALMADLTRTRPGTGATMLRALDGLNIRLQNTRFSASLLEVRTCDQLLHMPTPMLTTLKVESRQHHMVVIERVDPTVVHLHDPVVGSMILDHASFNALFAGQVIILRGPALAVR